MFFLKNVIKNSIQLELLYNIERANLNINKVHDQKLFYSFG